MQIDFIIEPDKAGKGRVIVNGRFYGLPLETVLDYKRLRDAEVARNETFNLVMTVRNAIGLVHNNE